MKSHLYAATMAKVYSEATAYYKKHGHFLSEKIYEWEAELKKVTHRTYAPSNLIEKAGPETIFDEREHGGDSDYVMVGRVVEVVEDDAIIIEVRNAFNLGEELELMPFSDGIVPIHIDQIRLLSNETIERTKPSTLVKIPYRSGISFYNIVRKRRSV
jgi:putative protease